MKKIGPAQRLGRLVSVLALATAPGCALAQPVTSGPVTAFTQVGWGNGTAGYSSEVPSVPACLETGKSLAKGFNQNSITICDDKNGKTVAAESCELQYNLRWTVD